MRILIPAILKTFTGLLVVCLAVSFCKAQVTEIQGSLDEWQEEMTDSDSLPTNWKLPTMGGTQFWSDLRHSGGWRIQQHCTTKHCRVLDPANTRHAWGTPEQCQQVFAQMIAAGQIPPNRETVVILAHGLARTRGCWLPMTEYLKSEVDWQVIDFTYASTRLPMDSHAQSLQSVIDSLGPEVKQIYLAGHSMGNIVFRLYLGNTTSADGSTQGDPRIRRLVMIGPPNHGSKMARVLQPTGIFPLVTGRSGVQLGRDWNQIAEKLATPQCEFAIIAGGNQETDSGYNPLLSGPDDLTVSLDEARLAGATDLLVQPLLHSTMMKQPEVCAATLRFFQTGCLTESGVRHPVGPDDDAPSAAIQR
jgi:pimeloyl-ACP methyl ester carboxylesterase